MQDKWMGIFRVIYRSALELLIFFPVFFIPGAYVLDLPHAWYWLASLLIYPALGYVAGVWIPMNKKSAVLLPLAAIALIGNWLVLGLSFFWVFSVPMSGYLFLRGVRSHGVSWDIQFPVKLVSSGLLSYFFAAGIFFFVDSFSNYYAYLNYFGIAALVAAFIRLNSSNLSAGSLSSKKEASIASSVMRQNRFLLFGLLAIVFLVVSLGFIRDAFVWVKDQISAFIHYLFGLIFKESDRMEMGDPVDSEMSGIGEGTENSGIADLLETIGFYFAMVVLVIVGILLIILIMKKLPGWIRKISKWLNSSFQVGQKETEQGFEDEKEALVDWKKWRKNLGGRFKDWMTSFLEREPKWNDIEGNRERIRYLYRYWITRKKGEGYKYNESMTPGEIAIDVTKWKKEEKVPEKLIPLYEKVRYSDHNVEQPDVNEAKKQTDPDGKLDRK